MTAAFATEIAVEDMRWSGDDIVAATGAKLAPAAAVLRFETFEGVSIDSRKVPERSLFVALRGERHDAVGVDPFVQSKRLRQPGIQPFSLHILQFAAADAGFLFGQDPDRKEIAVSPVGIGVCGISHGPLHLFVVPTYPTLPDPQHDFACV